MQVPFPRQLLAVAWKQETLPTYKLPDYSPCLPLSVQRMYLAMLPDTVILKKSNSLKQSNGRNFTIQLCRKNIHQPNKFVLKLELFRQKNHPLHPHPPKNKQKPLYLKLLKMMNVEHQFIKTSVSNKNVSYPELFYPLLCLTGFCLKTLSQGRGKHHLCNRQTPTPEPLLSPWCPLNIHSHTTRRPGYLRFSYLVFPAHSFCYH